MAVRSPWSEERLVAGLGGAGRPGSGAVSGPAIRRARPEDLSAIGAIERLSFTDPWSEEAFEVALRRREVRFTVAEVPSGGLVDEGGTGALDGERRVVGFLLAWFIADEGEIANVAVHPDWRGHGVGSALLDDVLADARAGPVTAVYLEVRASNNAAQALYASRGFQRVGRRRGYYSNPVEDAILLRWEGGDMEASV